MTESTVISISELRVLCENFLKQYEYDPADVRSIMANFDIISRSEYSRLMLEHLANYRAESPELDKLTADAARAAEACGLSEYEGRFIFFLALLPFSDVYFRKAGVSEQVIRDSLLDFKWKVEECKRIYGKCGIFSNWMGKWFTAKRFAFGRLEFELTAAEADFECEAVRIKKGDPVVGVHIPSNSRYPFDPKTCRDAYRQAYEYFSPMIGAPTVFECCSWMTWSENLRLLPPSSNIHAFASDYKTVSTTEASYHNWRIFGTMDMSDPTKLPENTSLQRIYKKVLTTGRSICVSLGYFCYEERFPCID